MLRYYPSRACKCFQYAKCVIVSLNVMHKARWLRSAGTCIHFLTLVKILLMRSAHLASVSPCRHKPVKWFSLQRRCAFAWRSREIFRETPKYLCTFLSSSFGLTVFASFFSPLLKVIRLTRHLKWTPQWLNNQFESYCIAYLEVYYILYM